MARLPSQESLDYQLSELEIARDPTHPAHLLPPIGLEVRKVLDVGCGAGQSLIVTDPRDRLLVGIDLDLAALRLGKSLSPQLHLVCGSGEALPFRADSFDLVASRVSLPYMNLSAAVREMSRVLLPAGALWCSLHPFRLTLGELRANISSAQFRAAAYRLCVLLNGVLLMISGRQLPARWLRGRNESFQSRRALRRALVRADFSPESIAFVRRRFFVVSARKSQNSRLPHGL